MKKSTKVLIICVLVTIVISAVSCRKSDNKSKSTDDMQGKITVLTDKKHEKSLRKYAENFKKLHEKADINLKIEDNPYAVFEESVKKNDSTIDVTTIDDAYVQYYINKLPNAFLDVSGDIDNYKDKLSSGKVDNLTSKSKVYGFPWTTAPKLILYRSDILSSEGINANDIKTWNDYMEMSKKVSKDTGKKILANVDDDNNDMQLLLANELGISYFNKNNKLNFNDKAWTKVLETLKNLYSQNIIYDASSKEEVIDKAEKEEIVSFVADPYYISYFMNKITNQKGKWGVMKLPAFEPGGNRDVSLGGSNLMINNISKNKKLSKDFIKFVITDNSTSIENMKDEGIFSCNKDIYNLIAFNKSEEYFNSKIWGLLGNIEKGAYSVTYTPYFFNVRDDAKNILSGYNLQSKDTKTILESFQKDLERKINIK